MSIEPGQLWWDGSYFCYEAEKLPSGKISVSPAQGYRLQWGESYDDCWEMEECDFLSCFAIADVSQAL